jgi:hypothetical protein
MGGVVNIREKLVVYNTTKYPFCHSFNVLAMEKEANNTRSTHQLQK